MDLMGLCFLDTETTGLDPHRHEIWEIGMILRGDDNGRDGEYLWQLPVDLSRADPIALNIGGFHKRRVNRSQLCNVAGHPMVAEIMAARPTAGKTVEEWAAWFVDLTRDAHLVGAVVSFDERRLWDLLRSLGQCPMWHYHLIDVEALAAGFVAGDRSATTGSIDDPDDRARPPWDSTELSAFAGVDRDRFAKHTALGDARWAEALYDKVLG